MTSIFNSLKNQNAKYIPIIKIVINTGLINYDKLLMYIYCTNDYSLVLNIWNIN